jgi:hypothetical protein
MRLGYGWMDACIYSLVAGLVCQRERSISSSHGKDKLFLVRSILGGRYIISSNCLLSRFSFLFSVMFFFILSGGLQGK